MKRPILSALLASLWCLTPTVPLAAGAPGGDGFTPARATEPKPGGTVSGTVTDESGRPLASCRVEFENATKAVNGVWPTAYTDEAGHFRISNVPWGTHNVGTTCHGFPNSLYSLYAGTFRQTVTLSPDSPGADVNVVRKDKEGRIVKINVIDGTTGKRITRTDPGSGNSIDAYSVGIYRVDNPKFGLEGGLGSTIYVPADIPVIVKVWSQGYSTWYYGGAPDLEHAKPLLVQAGQDISLDVTLQPVPEQ